ncbi:MAG: hypothetical protein CM1200mP40_20420 [Gammaproteobacteria bacterium]|nr:MAG: hypothetical protein CM1200mP40_20420 [Gammaproteobacteria bacterium]
MVKEISEKEVIVDFNHPLAGKDIVFKVKIVSVVSSDTDAVEVKVKNKAMTDQAVSESSKSIRLANPRGFCAGVDRPSIL